MHRHNNGLKTVLLLGGLWAVLLAIGWVVASGTGSGPASVSVAVPRKRSAVKS